MPDDLDELFASASADLATRTLGPGADQAIAAARRRTVAIAAAAATAAIVVGVAALSFGGRTDSPPDPAPSPSVTNVPDVVGTSDAVWYDDAGLHHGDVVEQTAVPLRPSRWGNGAVLTLVRSGALYHDATRDEIWFHPWGGDARVVGHGSAYGPAGDPEGDNAAWFEGSELVVYDTNSSREIARITTDPVRATVPLEGTGSGNGFMQVSSDAVVWVAAATDDDTSGWPVRRLDLATRDVTEPEIDSFFDVHGETLVVGFENSSLLTVEDPNREPPKEPSFPTIGALDARTARLSPDGRFVLATWRLPKDSLVGISDLDSGETFPIFDDAEAGSGVGAPTVTEITWAYGSTALLALDPDDDRSPSPREGRGWLLLACDAEARACVELPTSGTVVPPS